MEATDQILIGRLAQHGDPEAFSTLLARYADMVYSTALRILRDHSLAADVTQETFFQLFKSAGRVTGSPGGWLHQVATRRAVDVIRQDASRRKREHTYATEQGVGSSASWAEVAPLVDAALEELPEEHREMLIQHFLQRKSMGQIAATRGISQPTVSRRVAEGLDWLRKSLHGKGVAIGVVPLQTLLLYTAEAAPESVLRGLGKVALAQAAGTQAAATGTTLLGSTMTIALTGAAAVVAVAFNLALPEPQWGPTPPIQKTARPQAAVTNSAPVIARVPAAADVPPQSPKPIPTPAIAVPSAKTYALAMPVLRMPPTNTPSLATNRPAANVPPAQIAGSPANPVPPNSAFRPYGWQPPATPPTAHARQVWVGPPPSAGLLATPSSFQVDRLRTNRFRAQAGVRPPSANSFQSHVRLGPARAPAFAPAAPPRKAPPSPQRKR